MSQLGIAALSAAQQALAAGVRGGQPERFQGPEVTQYLADVGITYPAPWCAAFVYWCFEQAVAADLTGIAVNPCPRTAGALHLYELAPARCRVNLPAPGDVFVLSHGGGKGHVGIVESASPDGFQITSVEGDTFATLAEARAAGDPAARAGDSVGRHTWNPADGTRGSLLGYLELGA